MCVVAVHLCMSELCVFVFSVRSFFVVSWFVCIKKNKGVNDGGAKHQQQIPYNGVDRHNTANEYIFARCENNLMLSGGGDGVGGGGSSSDTSKRMEFADRFGVCVCVCVTQINEKTITTKGISAWRVVCMCGNSTGASVTPESISFDSTIVKCTGNHEEELSESTPWSVRRKRTHMKLQRKWKIIQLHCRNLAPSVLSRVMNTSKCEDILECVAVLCLI